MKCNVPKVNDCYVGQKYDLDPYLFGYDAFIPFHNLKLTIIIKKKQLNFAAGWVGEESSNWY